jgi:hypothetical protein
MSPKTKNILYWVAFWVSGIFGVATYIVAKDFPEDYIGILSSVALCILCSIKIITGDDEPNEG